MVLKFTGERIVPGADNCEPTFAQKMYQEHIARYAFAAQFAAGADVLDVGCGVGYGSQWLAKAGAASIIGIDIAADAIDHARKNYFHSVITYRALDAAEIDLKGEVDLVTCFELIEHVEEQEKVLDGIKLALRSDGILVISTPRPLDDIRTHYHVHEMSFEELRNTLKKRFKFVEAYFERNYFTSFVGASQPKTIEQVVSVTGRFEIENADYFVFVASDEKPERFQNASDLLSMNDDSYVLNLENDVSVLRNAENNHLDRIRDLEVHVGDLSGSLAGAEQRAERISQIHGELSQVRQDLGLLRDEGADNQTRQAIVELKSETTALREGLALLREELTDRASAHHSAELAQLRAELDRVRQAHIDNMQKLAEAETAAFSFREENVRLRETGATVDALVTELNAVRYRLDYAESTLARFRGSMSWYLTRPIRWTGRTFKKVIGRRT